MAGSPAPIRAASPYAILKALTEEYHFSLDTPFREYPDEIKDVLINGTHGKELKYAIKDSAVRACMMSHLTV